jgi:hypothetical protein
MSNLMLDVCNKTAASLVGASVATAAWAVHLVVYPAALAYAYGVRASWPACQDALEAGALCFPIDEERAA